MILSFESEVTLLGCMAIGHPPLLNLLRGSKGLLHALASDLYTERSKISRKQLDEYWISINPSSLNNVMYVQ